MTTEEQTRIMEQVSLIFKENGIQYLVIAGKKTDGQEKMELFGEADLDVNGLDLFGFSERLLEVNTLLMAKLVLSLSQENVELKTALSELLSDKAESQEGDAE